MREKVKVRESKRERESKERVRVGRRKGAKSELAKQQELTN